MWHITLLFFYQILQIVYGRFQVPIPNIEIFKPHGFRVSIPDIPGIRLFAFHGKINEPMIGREAGTFSRDITQPTNGRWVFSDKHFRLNPGDTLYYWLYVEFFDGERVLGYPLDNQVFKVSGIDIEKISDLVSKESNDHKNKNQILHIPFQNQELVNQLLNPNQNKNSNSQETNCEKSETIVNGKSKCRGELIFEDNFEGRSLSQKWKPQIIFSGSPDHEFCIYTDESRNLYVEDGILNIKPTLTEDTYGKDFLNTELNLGRKCTGIKGTNNCYRKAFSYNILPPVLSSKITSKKYFNFLYGRVEIKAKLPKGDWIYPELFLDPKNSDYGTDYNSGQLRVAFSAGNQLLADKLNGGAILGNSEKLRKYAIKETELNTELWSDNFHVYVIEWKPRKINLFVNDKEYGSIVAPLGGFASIADKVTSSIWKESQSPLVPFDKEMYLTLGVGVGGNNFFDDHILKEEKVWKNKDPKGMLHFWTSKDQWYQTWNNSSRLQIDYVKVYAL